MRRLIVLLLVVFAVPLAAQTVHEEMLVSTEWLGNHPEGAAVIEIGERGAYEVAHVPGAVLIETGELLTQLEDTPNELPSVEALEAVWTRAGAGNRGRIILYSRDPLLAARAWFTLDYLGHGQRTSILDGGFTRWADEGRPTSSAVYASAGVNPRSTNVVYCRTGMQASLTYFVLRYLGYAATLYDGSYVEWSGDPATAIAEVPPLGHGRPTEGDIDAYDTDPAFGLATDPR